MKQILNLLLIFLFLSALTACQPALKEFQPDKDSLFQISFSYPASWNLESHKMSSESPPNEENPYLEILSLPQDFPNGDIGIQAYKESNPQVLLQGWADLFLTKYASVLKSDVTVQIDGHDARWFTVIFPPSTTTNNYQETIFFYAGDRFYAIGFICPESETNGLFHKQFKEFIKSIKFLP
ncbi:MAG: hypothetical protein IPP55_09055 [Anaerolineales bacterium]|nr:hypothetical protein [Anaerolineales bacterium]